MTSSYVCDIISAPVDQVWAALRDFGDLHYFEDAVSCTLGGGETGTTVGAVRTVHLKNGASAQERLLGLDDHYHRATYALIDNPQFAFTGYVATLQLTALTRSGETLLEWRSDYEVDDQNRASVAEFIEQGVYGKCIEGLKKAVER